VGCAEALVMADAPDGVKPTTCRSCGAVVWWALTAGNNQRMLMNVGSDETHEWVTCGRSPGTGMVKVRRFLPLFDDASEPRYQPHWATCPKADEWRKKK